MTHSSVERAKHEVTQNNFQKMELLAAVRDSVVDYLNPGDTLPSEEQDEKALEDLVKDFVKALDCLETTW